jgi:hypothetical protein
MAKLTKAEQAELDRTIEQLIQERKIYRGPDGCLYPVPTPTVN